MTIAALGRRTGYALMVSATFAYFYRPWSSGQALSSFSRTDDVAYAGFDAHGWSVMAAWLVTLIFAGPVLWLAYHVFLRRPARVGMFGRARDTKTTVWSVLVALGLAAPMHTQLLYLAELPARVSAPVLVSALLWLLVVEIGRTAAVQGEPISKGAVRVAIGIVALTIIPKLVWIGYDTLNA